MIRTNRFLIIIFILLFFIIIIEINYLFFFLPQTKQNANVQKQNIIPTPTKVVQNILSLSEKDDLKYFTKQIYDIVNSNYLNFKSTTAKSLITTSFQTTTVWEGKIIKVYQGKDIDSIYKVDPKQPARENPALILKLMEDSQDQNIYLNKQEADDLKIIDQQGVTSTIDQLSNKNVRITAIRSLELKKDVKPDFRKAKALYTIQII